MRHDRNPDWEAAARLNAARLLLALRMDANSMTRGTVGRWSWRLVDATSRIYEVSGRYRGGPRPVMVTLRPCGTMRYSTDNGQSLPAYLVEAIEAADLRTTLMDANSMTANSPR